MSPQGSGLLGGHHAPMMGRYIRAANHDGSSIYVQWRVGDHRWHVSISSGHYLSRRTQGTGTLLRCRGGTMHEMLLTRIEAAPETCGTGF